MTHLPSLDALKTQAKQLKQALAAKGQDLAHGQCLDLIARQHGLRDWNTLHAKLGNTPPALALGQHVTGRYLGQPFKGEVISLAALGDSHTRVTLRFEKPVDVVPFDSFSNFRQQVSVVLTADRRTVEQTSDGTPHMVITS